MNGPHFLIDGPDDASLTLALAHGAGAPMDSPFMQAMAEGVAANGFRVARFEFPYMAKRRATGQKKPPDRADILLAAWRDVVGRLGPERLVVGGKSMGGRIASMVADGVGARGLVCLGYPFHPPGKPQNLRVEHLSTMRTPTLILQGERDPFGTPPEVAGYDLPPAIKVAWIADGDHSFKPRKSSGRTERQNWDDAILRIAAFLKALPDGAR